MDLLSKAAVTVFSLIGGVLAFQFRKKALDVRVGRSKLTYILRLEQDVLNERRLSAEYLFEQLLGCSAAYDEIKLLIRCVSPWGLMKDFRVGRKHVQLDAGTNKFIFLKEKGPRTFFLSLGFVAVAFLASVAFALSLKQLATSEPEKVLLWWAIVTPFALLSWTWWDELRSIFAARRLVAASFLEPVEWERATRSASKTASSVKRKSKANE
ncbi:MAG: hypothetical protein ACK4E7_10250 [Permianibacter sp.]